jgi:hypothetical protein
MQKQDDVDKKKGGKFISAKKEQAAVKWEFFLISQRKLLS